VVKLELDHVVFAARNLDEGMAWCEATLGIVPGPGGRHAFMGTHNRLFSVASPEFPRAYCEIIAIDPAAAAPARRRWFDLDLAVQALAGGPKLWHWVARTSDLASAGDALRSIGVDGGEPLQAQRETDRGTLRWRISVRPDGRRLCDGALPTLIEWSGAHPADAMPPSGVRIVRVDLAGLPAGMASWLPVGVFAVGERAAPITLTLDTPRGQVQLHAPSAAA
jgi:Glyoxalase-like domain